MGSQVAGGPQVRDGGGFDLPLSAPQLAFPLSLRGRGMDGAGRGTRISVAAQRSQGKVGALIRDEQGDSGFTSKGQQDETPALARERPVLGCGKGDAESGRHRLEGKVGRSPDLAAKQRSRESQCPCQGSWGRPGLRFPLVCLFV